MSETGGTPPRGRDAVVAALLEAAGRELAARGVTGVSIRSVAAAAGVNHGLVHRHFGSKDGLVAAVLDDLAQRIADRTAADPGWPFALDGAGADDELLDRFVRVLARSLLDGDGRVLQHHHPTMAALVARLRDRGLDEDAARLGSAQVAALTLGWLLFEPFLEASADLPPAERGGRRRALGHAAEGLVTRLVTPPSGRPVRSEPPG